MGRRGISCVSCFNFNIPCCIATANATLPITSYWSVHVMSGRDLPTLVPARLRAGSLAIRSALSALISPSTLSVPLFGPPSAIRFPRYSFRYSISTISFSRYSFHYSVPPAIHSAIRSAVRSAIRSIIRSPIRPPPRYSIRYSVRSPPLFVRSAIRSRERFHTTPVFGTEPMRFIRSPILLSMI